ncbi:MAG: ribosome maturation factor RimM [Candidatus Nanopelagicales bacterium]
MGRVGKPHGVKGWVTVVPSTDEPERRFAPGTQLQVGDSTNVVAESRINGPRVTLRLEGYTDRDQAQTLRGTWLHVDIDPSESPAEPDAFYDHQLVGLEVRADSSRIGTVAEVLHLPAQDVLAVDLDSGRQVLVPFVEQIVPLVDPERGIVEIEPVEGLIDDED